MLIDVVLEHKSVIDHTKTDSSSTKCKEEAWKEIAYEYNFKNGYSLNGR